MPHIAFRRLDILLLLFLLFIIITKTVKIIRWRTTYYYKQVHYSIEKSHTVQTHRIHLMDYYFIVTHKEQVELTGSLLECPQNTHVPECVSVFNGLQKRI